MNKTDLVERVQTILNDNGSKFLKKDIEKIVNCVFDVQADALVDGDKICIVGFGTTEPVERAERKGRAPQTKLPMVIPAHMTAVFRPGKRMKEGLAVLLGKGF